MRFKKLKPHSDIHKSLELKRSKIDDCIGNFKISFQHFEPSQRFGSCYRDWERASLLATALKVLEGYCKRPLKAQVDGRKFTIYGDFPPDDKTRFTHPVHVPEDANWARIHITGAAVIAGHVHRDTFYVVFFDRSHKFYMTDKITSNIN